MIDMKAYHCLIIWFCFFTSLCFSQEILIAFEDKTNSIDTIQIEGLYAKSELLSIKKTLEVKWDAKGIDYVEFIVWAKNRKKHKERYWINGTKIQVRFEQKKGEPFRIRLEGSPISEELQAFKMLQMRQQFRDMDMVYDFFYEKAEKHRAYPVASVFLTPLVTSFGSDTMRLEQLYDLIKDQSEVVKSTYVMQPMHKQLERLFNKAPFDIGKFVVLDSSKQAVRLEVSSYSEPYILLDLWFVNCPPCVMDHQLIKKDFEAKTFKKDIKLISISVDKLPEEWLRYLKEKKLPWDHYLEDQTLEKAYTKELGVISYPAYFLLDQNGKILGRRYSYKNVIALYEDLNSSKDD